MSPDHCRKKHQPLQACAYAPQGRPALPWLGRLHYQVERTIGQRGLQGGAGLGLLHAGHRVALAIAEQGVAALQYQVRIEQLQAQGSALQALAMIGQGDNLNATIAWVYVGLRVVHSIYHATINKVMVRFGLFALSSIVLIMLVTHAAIAVFHG